MNIGIVTTWFERGAAYVSKQLKEAIERDYLNNVFIYARGGESDGKGDLKWDHDYVTWGKQVWLPTVTTPIDETDFKKWLRNNRIDIVIFNEQHWLPPLLWCKELRVKTIAYVDYYKETTIDLFEVYDYLICNTKRHYELFKWHNGARFIPWGTNLDIYKPAEAEHEVFFHSAGMAPIRKGTDLLLEAFYKSNQKWKLVIHTQVPLTKIGNKDYSEIITSLESTGRLEVIQKSVSAPGLYHVGAVYVYPSRLDGIGLTVAEAMACGLIPVVTDCPPMNEFTPMNFKFNIPVDKFYSRSDGYYWPISEVNVDKLSIILDGITALNEEELSRLKKESYNFAIENLDWKKNSIKLVELIKEVEANPMKELSIELKTKILNFSNSGINKVNKYIIKYNFIFRSFLRIIKSK